MNRIAGTSPLERYEVASGATIAEGDIVALNAAGKAVAATDAADISVVGVAFRTVDGKVEVESGIVSIANDTTNAVARTGRGSVVYIKDKNTVTSAAGTNSVAAGIAVDVLDGEVYVDFSPAALAAVRRVIPAPGVWAADPSAASSANFGKIFIVGTAWTSGTVIATGVVGDVYISVGTAYKKLN